MGLTELRYTKWDGTPHWHFQLEHLGEDEHGLWLGAPWGRALQRGDEPIVESPVGFACLIPREGWWTAYFNDPDDTAALQIASSDAVEVYVDLTDRPRRLGDAVETIDLDLDVIRWGDGRVTLEDEDEFLDHRIRYRYPPEIVERVEATAQHLLQIVSAREEPFGSASAPWLARLNS